MYRRDSNACVITSGTCLVFPPMSVMLIWMDSDKAGNYNLEIELDNAWYSNEPTGYVVSTYVDSELRETFSFPQAAYVELTNEVGASDPGFASMDNVTTTISPYNIIVKG